MRAGNWLLDYSIDRLDFMSELQPAIAFAKSQYLVLIK